MDEKIIRTLLIDGDPKDAAAFARLLSSSEGPAFQFILKRAKNLSEGFQVLIRGGIEAILLDLMLPDSRGIETAWKVLARFPDIPLIAMSDLGDEALGLELIRSGAQDYQPKGKIASGPLKRSLGYAVERSRSLATFKNMIMRSADGLVALNDKGWVRFVNPAAEALFGIKANQWLSRPFPYALSPDRFTEIKIPGETGERIAQARVSRVAWEEVPASLVAIREITELRRVERLKAEIVERQRANKMKDAWVKAVSHKMREPLAAIKAATNHIEESLAETLSPPQTDLMALQRWHIQRLENILETALPSPLRESGPIEIEIQPRQELAIPKPIEKRARAVAGDRDLSFTREISYASKT